MFEKSGNPTIPTNCLCIDGLGEMIGAIERLCILYDSDNKTNGEDVRMVESL